MLPPFKAFSVLKLRSMNVRTLLFKALTSPNGDHSKKVESIPPPSIQLSTACLFRFPSSPQMAARFPALTPSHRPPLQVCGSEHPAWDPRARSEGAGAGVPRAPSVGQSASLPLACPLACPQPNPYGLESPIPVAKPEGPTHLRREIPPHLHLKDQLPRGGASYLTEGLRTRRRGSAWLPAHRHAPQPITVGEDPLAPPRPLADHAQLSPAELRIQVLRGLGAVSIEWPGRVRPPRWPGGWGRGSWAIRALRPTKRSPHLRIWVSEGGSLAFLGSQGS